MTELTDKQAFNHCLNKYDNLIEAFTDYQMRKPQASRSLAVETVLRNISDTANKVLLESERERLENE